MTKAECTQALGDVDTDNPENRAILQEMKSGLTRAARHHKRIPLILGYLHTFPGVLWASVGGTDEALKELDRLRFDVKLNVANAEIRGLMTQPDRYDPWLPHITLGRFEVGQTAQLARALQDSDFPQQVRFHIESLEMLESLSRTDGGPEYEPLEEMPAMMLR